MMVISNILSIFAEIFDESLESEALYGYFFNLSQLTFTGTGVGGIAPILQGEFGVKNYVVIIFGIVMTFIFAGIANRILKY